MRCGAVRGGAGKLKEEGKGKLKEEGFWRSRRPESHFPSFSSRPVRAEFSLQNCDWKICTAALLPRWPCFFALGAQHLLGTSGGDQ